MGRKDTKKSHSLELGIIVDSTTIMITNNSKKILLVDDSTLYRTKMNHILTEAGHDVDLLEDGAQLIKQLDKSIDEIDMIVLDLQMPNVDGFGVLEWLQKHDVTGKFPVVCVTGAYDPKKVTNRLIKDLGASGLITKDFSPEKTILCLNEFLFSVEQQGAREVRASAFAPAEFTVLGETYKGHLLNISPNGVFLQTTMNLMTGTYLMLKFLLPQMGHTQLCIKSEVQWTTPEKHKKSRFAGAGVKFTHFFRELNKKIINDYLQENKEKPYLL